MKVKLDILLAESNVISQKIITKQLQSLGYEAEVAKNGQEVLQLLQEKNYHLILMNCQMPILDGYETTKEILHKSGFDSTGFDLPFIIGITANSIEEDRKKCLDIGMNDCIRKPIAVEKLNNCLENWYELIVNDQSHLNTSSQVKDQSPDSSDNNIDSILDWDTLHLLCDNSREMEIELLNIFVVDAQQHIEKAKNAIASLNFSEIAREAHHLKGSSANMGVVKITQIAEKLENFVNSSNPDKMNQLIEEIQTYIYTIQSFLEREE